MPKSELDEWEDWQFGDIESKAQMENLREIIKGEMKEGRISLSAQTIHNILDIWLATIEIKNNYYQRLKDISKFIDEKTMDVG